MLIYDELHKDVTIEWVEEKKDKLEPHTLRRKPILCQLNPMGNGRIIRVQFKGAKPPWIDRYIKTKEGKNFIVNEVRTINGVGFTMTDRYADALPCPFIKGMIEEWFEKIDVEYHSFKIKLLDNLEIVEKNLKHYSEVFTHFGLYFRKEEIEGNYGSMFIEKDQLVPTEDWGGSLFHFEQCIDSLVEVREYPFEEELMEEVLLEEILELPAVEELIAEEIIEEELLDETVIDFPVLEFDIPEETFKNELTEEQLLDEELLVEELLEEGQLEDLPNELVVPEEELLPEQMLEEELLSEEMLEEEQMNDLLEIEETLGEDTLEEVDEISSLETLIVEEDEEKEIEVIVEQPSLKIAEKSDSKEGVLVGQILLF
ncbi:MAG: hypothetical protein ABS939_00115 [Psychrobacillus sp.]